MPRAISPRRSSRARTSTQPPPSGPPHSNSSFSMSSNRAERSTRSNNKNTSSHKSSTPRSLSSEDADEGADQRLPQTRRRTRGDQDPADDDSAPRADETLDEDDAGEEDEEEITRCVCGHQDYPGPPSDGGKHHDSQSEESGGLFIQCDICKVWQHGGCVGIMDEATSPEEYFCEECRNELHKLMTSPKGQRYSRYLPVYEYSRSHRRKSISKEVDGKAREKEKEKLLKAQADSLTKRRSTMNSRAAYDEDEALKKALEESKGDNRLPLDEASIRNGKRNRDRDDSEDIRQEVKRQRTNSQSISSPLSERSAAAESDDDEQTPRASQNGTRKSRGAAARNHREKEQREREKERERERAEAANRRKGRAERRRAGDSEPPEDAPRDNELGPAIQEAPVSKASPDSPAPTSAPHNANQKKGGRPPAKRGRVGRNQYTRDRDMQGENSLSPSRASSRNDPGDIKDTMSPQGRSSGMNGNAKGESNESGGNSGGGSVTSEIPAPGSIRNNKTSKSRVEKTSLNDLRRRAAAMLSFISRTQLELAGERPTSESAAATAVANMLEAVNGEDGASGEKAIEASSTDLPTEADFKALSSTAMMDVLTRKLLKFQQEWGKPGGN